MKKIGLCLAFKGQNYGMLLQAFATQQIVKRLGYETEIIDYQRTNLKHIRFTPYLLVFYWKQLLNKLTNRKKVIELDECHKINLEKRKEKAEEFRQEHLENIIKCIGIDELEKNAEKYDGVLVGSDQQWLPDVAFSNFRTLRFVPDHINKISYATSLGVSTYPHYCKSSAKNFLERIDYCSVREQEGKNIINSICNIDVKVVLDPTYLFTKEEWLDLIPSRKMFEYPYLFCYFLGNSDQQKQKARKFADKNNLKIVSILSNESTSDLDLTYADFVVSGASPEDFINWIRGAKFVFTDSFHGVAFSIINEKQFYVFYRRRLDSKTSRNSRIDNILRTFELNNRLILDQQDISNNENIIDYHTVNEILNDKRARSLHFLKNALDRGNIQ